MDKLTKERLEEYAKDGRNAGDVEVESMARELLSLRDAGDEELALIGERFQCAETEYHRIQAYKDLEAAAIDRGQKLSEAREEIERLKESVDSRVPSLVAQIVTLTAEREEVVGLLDHILSCIITVRQENTPEWMEYIVEEVNKVNEAMGDSDRVELSRGDIVIVKGGSEIVEGNHA